MRNKPLPAAICLAGFGGGPTLNAAAVRPVATPTRLDANNKPNADDGRTVVVCGLTGPVLCAKLPVLLKAVLKHIGDLFESIGGKPMAASAVMLLKREEHAAANLSELRDHPGEVGLGGGPCANFESLWSSPPWLRPWHGLAMSVKEVSRTNHGDRQAKLADKKWPRWAAVGF